MDIVEIAHHVHSAASLRMRGIGRARREELVRSKRLVAVHRGWYVEAAKWSGWHGEERHAAEAIAAVRAMRDGDVVLSHTSAAVVWGLPLFRYTPRRVHVTGPRGNGVTRTKGVARHVAEIDGDRADLHGLPVTSLARTVADLVGTLPLVAAVALADAALRAVSWDPARRRYDEAAAERLRVAIASARAMQPGARGSVQARWVVRFADGRAESPLESCARLWLYQLGFAPPRVQVRIVHSSGFYEVDLGLEDADVWLEIDGDGKYTDPAMIKDRSTAEVVLTEKRREDDIRSRTGRRLIRAGTVHLQTAGEFRTHLAQAGVHPPGGLGAVPPGIPTSTRSRASVNPRNHA